jgi:hypothetical protein
MKHPPVVFDGNSDLTEIAGYLIKRAGGAQAARDAISRANRALKKPRGRPPRGDIFSLLIAGNIQEHEKCSRWQALQRAAQFVATKEDPVENILRRLQDKLKKLDCKTLSKFAERCRLKVTRNMTRERQKRPRCRASTASEKCCQGDGVTDDPTKFEARRGADRTRASSKAEQQPSR